MATDVIASPVYMPVAANKWAIAFAVALGALLEVIDTSIVNVALTDMATSLNATIAETSWIVSSYAVANVIILPLSAWLGHRFGQKRYFLFSLVGFVAASILCGFSTSLPMLIIARTLQGLMGGGLLAKAQSILFQVFPREQQAMAQAFFGIVVISGPAIGPTLGGFLVTNVDWRWIFFINLPLGILAIFMVWLSLPKDPARPLKSSPVDYLGIIFLAIGLGCLQTLLEEGNRNDWFESTEMSALAIASGLALIFFVYRELTTAFPAVNLRVLRYRSLWAGSIMSIILGVALYGALFAIPIFSQQVMGMTPLDVGVMLLPSALAAGFMMPIAGILLSKGLPPRIGLVMGAMILATTLFMLTPLTTQTGADDFFWPLLIRGAGMVFLFLPLNMSTLGPIPKHDVAAASGFFNLTRQLGGSIGVAWLSTFLVNRLALHKAAVVEHLVSNDPAVIDRLSTYAHALQAKGMSLLDAQHGAIAILDRAASVQASVLAFADIFWYVAVLVIGMIPLVFILGKPPKSVKVEMGH